MIIIITVSVQGLSGHGYTGRPMASTLSKPRHSARVHTRGIMHLPLAVEGNCEYGLKRLKREAFRRADSGELGATLSRSAFFYISM